VMLLGGEKIIYKRVIRHSINNGKLSKSRDEIFIRGEGCKILGVRLPKLHLHFISMSIISFIMHCLACNKGVQHTLLSLFQKW
jgi:hypothetical protein